MNRTIRLLSALMAGILLFSLLPASALAAGETGEDVKITETRFPDKVFRAFVEEKYDRNNDGYLSLTDEIFRVEEMDVSGMGIEDLTGIEVFRRLTKLRCYGNGLTSLDVSENTLLETLDCDENHIAALDVSKNEALTGLYCKNNDLTALTVGKKENLTSIDCSGNKIAKLDLTGCGALTSLACGNNKLTRLTLSGCVSLTELDCFENQLTGLNLSDCLSLTELDCQKNDLTKLDVSPCPALWTLHAENNSLTTLNAQGCEELVYLMLEENKLESIDLTGCKILRQLECRSNSFSSLSIPANETLIFLDCSENPNLTSLDVSGCAGLTALNCQKCSLGSLDTTQNPNLTGLACMDNRLQELNLSGNPEMNSLGCFGNNIAYLDLSRTPTLALAYNDGERSDHGSYYYYQYRSSSPYVSADLTVDKTTKVNAPGNGRIYFEEETPVKLKKPFEDYVFATGSSVYNPELAGLLMAMSRSAYREPSVRDSLYSMGFTEIECYHYNNDGRAAYSFAKKPLGDKTLVLVTVRGSSNIREWITDFTVGEWPSFEGRPHIGFMACAKELLSDLERYVGGFPAPGVTFVLTGHSLGAATANLAAYGLSTLNVSAENVYDYNFACPDVAEAPSSAWSGHDNMFNLGNCADPVSFVPGFMGDIYGIPNPKNSWGKYGVSRWWSDDWSSVKKLDFGAHDSALYKQYFLKSYGFSALKTIGQMNLAYGPRLLIRIIPMLLVSSGRVSNSKAKNSGGGTDVIVYDAGGKAVAGVVGGTVKYYDSVFGDVIIGTAGEGKAIALPADGEYRVEIVGSGNGSVSYSVETTDVISREVGAEKVFSTVAVEPGRTLISDIGGATDVEDVRLFVTDEDGTPTAEVFPDGTETEVRAPVITAQPKKITVASGKTATFTVTARGEDLHYRWYCLEKDGNVWKRLDGENDASLTFTARSGQSGNKYRCEVESGGVPVKSSAAELTVVTKPKITTQPKSVSVKAGTKVTFKVKASGGGLSYQWYRLKPGTKKWVKINKATKAAYSFKAARKWNGYKYKCLVKNKAGKLYTKAAKLTVK